MKIKDSKWEMTADYVGMSPKFRVLCWDCMMNDFLSLIQEMLGCNMDWNTVMTQAWVKVYQRSNACEYDMLLREAHCTKLPAISDRAFANNMHYKCCKFDGCDRVKVFGVPIDKEYYDLLMGRRNGKAQIQPRHQWEENEDIKKQLKGIGYI
jgi:hypothetical protein